MTTETRRAPQLESRPASGAGPKPMSDDEARHIVGGTGNTDTGSVCVCGCDTRNNAPCTCAPTHGHHTN